MKHLALSVMLFAVTGWATTGLRQGTYTGTGHWVASNGISGDYSDSLTITGNQFTSTYVYASDTGSVTKTVKGEVQVGKNGFFTVAVEAEGAKSSASGYCNSTGEWCHYGAKTADGWMEESFVTHEDKLYKLGSKSVKGIIVHWEETLTKSR